MYALWYFYRSNVNDYTFNLKADFDEPLVLEGMYNIQGKIIILPIRGDGKSNLTLGRYLVPIIYYNSNILFEFWM